ncbi:MAG: DUF2608 domain-containing protein [Coxiellaceae bacterium]|nr:DUF2608 domain-containing protein [Coxiellaceae bacterium]
MFRTVCIASLIFICSQTLFANSTIITANSFDVVNALIAKDKTPSNTLLALDDDDTLTAMPCDSSGNCQHLGGPSWYQWQSSLAEGSADRIWKNTGELLSINKLVFAMSSMPLTDPAIPSTLENANKLGVSTVMVTARGYDMISETENQLSQDHILSIIENGALKTPTNHISFPDYYYPTPWNGNSPRQIAYVNGGLYVAGQDKGVMIKQFLEKTEQTTRISNIIFVDDTYQNDVDVANAYKNDPNVNVVCVYYTRLSARKEAFLTGKDSAKLQAQANQEWFNIRNILSKNLVGPNL